MKPLPLYINVIKKQSYILLQRVAKVLKFEIKFEFLFPQMQLTRFVISDTKGAFTVLRLQLFPITLPFI